MQAKDHGYDLEANLALLKLYQFNPTYLNIKTVSMILLKALCNLPHSDFVLCKCLLSYEVLENEIIEAILYLHDLMETCKFKQAWNRLNVQLIDIVRPVAGFEDSMRKFACHVISITYQHIQEETLCEILGLVDETVVNQWIAKNGWKSCDNGYVLISNQDDQIKTRKITEKVDLESVASIMAQCF